MGRIVVLIGPSGTGKTTIARELLREPLAPQMVPTKTTRLSRDTDLPDHYDCVSYDEILQLRGKQELLWDIRRGRTLYATQRSSVDAILKTPGATGIMILVPEVLDKLCAYVYGPTRSWSSLVLIYLVAPKQAELVKRMYRRGENELEIARRLKAEQDWDAWSDKSTLALRRISTAITLDQTMHGVLSILGTQSRAAS